MVGRIAAWFGRHALAAPLAIAIGSRIFSVVAIFAITAQGTQPLPLLTTDTSPFVAWDGQWYLSIAANGYHAAALQPGPHGGRLDLAFYPAWPFLIRVASLGVLPLGAVAPILASVLFCLAMPVMYFVLERHFSREAALGGLALLAFSPPSFVLSMAYSESLFLLLVALYFWQPRQALRPAMATLAMLARPVGLAIIASTLFTLVRQRSRVAVASAIGALAALACWWVFTWWLTGDPGVVVRATNWVGTTGLQAVGRTILHLRVDGYARLAFIGIVTVASIALMRRAPELAVFSLVAVTLGLLVGSVSSMPRYAMVAFPAFGVVAARVGRRMTVVLVILSAALELALIWSVFESVGPLSP